MRILMTERPADNGYMESLINAYKDLGHEVYCEINNFYFSNIVPDILHIHWPERFYKWHTDHNFKDIDILDVIQERIKWYKDNSTVIVYTVHNIRPHEISGCLDNEVLELIIKNTDIFVHHCAKSVDLFEDEYRNILSDDQKSIICNHGDYTIHYRKIDKIQARSRYGIPKDKVVTINFGVQRPYKNEKFITNVFDSVNNKSKYLVVAGRFSYPDDRWHKKLYFNLRNKKRKYIKRNDRKYIYKMFQVKELPYIMACADLAFLGQSTALNSGFIALAATYSVPLVIPDIGCLKTAASGWIYNTYIAADKADASKALNAMYNNMKNMTKVTNTKWLENNKWEFHAGKIIKTAQQQQK